MNKKYMTKISALLTAAMLGGSLLPVYADDPVTVPVPDAILADGEETATQSVKISANYYPEENHQYTIHFTVMEPISEFIKLDAKIGFQGSAVISAAFDDAVLTGASKTILRGEDYAVYSLSYENAATVPEKTRVFSLVVTADAAPTSETLTITDFSLTKADGTVVSLTADMTLQEGPIIPELDENEQAVYDAIIALPNLNDLSFYQEDGSLTDITKLQDEVTKVSNAYKKLSADGMTKVDTALEYYGYSSGVMDSLSAVFRGMSNARGVVEIAGVLKDMDAETVLNYQFLISVFREKKDFVNLGGLPQGSQVLQEAQATIATLESTSLVLDSALESAAYIDKAYACEDQITVIQGLSAHKYYGNYLTALSEQVKELTDEVSKNYNGRDKETVLDILDGAASTIGFIEKGVEDLPVMEVGKITCKKTYNITFTRKETLPELLKASVYVEVKNKDGQVIDTAEKEFVADSKVCNFAILAKDGQYPKNETIQITAYYRISGAEFLIDSGNYECVYHGSGSSASGLGGNSSSSGVTSSDSGGKGGGTIFPGASEDKPSENTENSEPDITELFGDLKNYDWAQEAVKELYDSGIVNGMEEGIFNPAGQVTREQFAKMVVQLFGLSSGGTRTNFSDVDESAWYAPYINAALQAGYIQGQSENYFGIGEPIMRQDMATILYRALGDQNSKAVLDFTDNDAIAGYAKDAIAELVGLGVINGYQDGSFQPRGTATRAEAAKMVYGIYSYLNKEA